MPDNEEQEAPQSEQEVPANFDWAAFWATPQPNGAPETPPPPAVSADDDDEGYDDLGIDADVDLAKEVEQLRKTVNMHDAQLSESQRQQRLDSAIDAWKEQASPAEQSLASLLYSSQSLEELKRNEVIVRQTAAKMDEEYTKRLETERKRMEQEMQAKFGLPVAPTFQPIPRQDLVDQKFKEGDLDGAAALMMEGFLTP